MLSGVPNRKSRVNLLLARLHELFGPRVVGVGLDPLPPAQVVDCDLADWKPSRTIRIFSSEVYLRRAAAFTVRTKDLVCSLRSSGRPLRCLLLIGTHLLLSAGSSTLISGAHTTPRLSGFPTLIRVPLSLTVYTGWFSRTSITSLTECRIAARSTFSTFQKLSFQLLHNFSHGFSNLLSCSRPTSPPF